MPNTKLKPFKWQNLLCNCCPKCEWVLFERKLTRGIYHNCSNTDCDFGISEEHFVRLLGDNTHPIQRFVSAEMKREILTLLKTKRI